MTLRAADAQCAAAAHGQGAVHPQGGVSLAEAVGRTGDGDGVLAALHGQDEHLVRLDGLNGRAAVGGERQPVQQQANLVVRARADDNLTVVHLAGEQIAATVGDGQHAVLQGIARAFISRAIVQDDGRRILGGCGLQIPGGELIFRSQHSWGGGFLRPCAGRDAGQQHQRQPCGYDAPFHSLIPPDTGVCAGCFVSFYHRNTHFTIDEG